VGHPRFFATRTAERRATPRFLLGKFEIHPKKKSFHCWRAQTLDQANSRPGTGAGLTHMNFDINVANSNRCLQAVHQQQVTVYKIVCSLWSVQSGGLLFGLPQSKLLMTQ
jgi:hypothetical protein